MSNEISITYDGITNVNVELPHGGTLAIGVPMSCGGTGQAISKRFICDRLCKLSDCSNGFGRKGGRF